MAVATSTRGRCRTVWRERRTSALLAALLAALLLAACCTGCEPGADERAETARALRDAAVERFCERLESVLGLPAGVVTESARSPYTEGADVLLEWGGKGEDGYAAGESEVDLDTGFIVTILREAHPGAIPAQPLSERELEAAAVGFAADLGWDETALAAAGFAPGEGELITRDGEAIEYAKTWAGRDRQGLPGRGLIDVRVDAATGEVIAFYYSP